MLKIKATQSFIDWIDDLKDLDGRARIQARIERLAGGNPGRHKRLKHGVCELKIDVGPGYRVYYTQNDASIVILLCGGDKASQSADVRRAYKLMSDLEL